MSTFRITTSQLFKILKNYEIAKTYSKKKQFICFYHPKFGTRYLTFDGLDPHDMPDVIFTLVDEQGDDAGQLSLRKMAALGDASHAVVHPDNVLANDRWLRLNDPDGVKFEQIAVEISDLRGLVQAWAEKLDGLTSASKRPVSSALSDGVISLKLAVSNLNQAAAAFAKVHNGEAPIREARGKAKEPPRRAPVEEAPKKVGRPPRKKV